MLNYFRSYNLPFFQGEDFMAALGSIHMCVSDRKLLAFIGPPGSGKTTAALVYENENFEIHYILCSPLMRIKDLLRAFACAIDIHVIGSAYEMQNAIVRELQQHPNHCFMLDECEYLNKNDLNKMEVIRQIWDQTKVPIVLIGTDKLEDEIKGGGRKGATNHPQIYRRLCRTRLGVLKQPEVYEYLSMIEEEYAVRFSQEAKSSLYQLCSDRENGGLGNFIEVLEMIFSLVRPEWKSISSQLNQNSNHANEKDIIMFDPNENDFVSEGSKSSPESEIIFEPVDVSSLELINITQDVILSAMDYKMRK